MKIKKILATSILIFSFLLISHQALASNTNGTINPSYRYAWGENVGFIDFGSTAGNVLITDTTLSGYAYGENIGWINLTGVINNNEGVLSGYAWGENVGFIDFSKVSIGNDGVFSGSAYGENIGWITFGTGHNKVMTDWRPRSLRPTRTSSGSTLAFRQNFLAQQVSPPVNPEYQQTTSTSAPTLLRTVRQGARGNDIKDLQSYLNTKLNLNLVTDGIFGRLTRQAVIQFQLANGLKGDGIVGPLTRAKLK
jgi:hypothetical protein